MRKKIIVRRVGGVGSNTYKYNVTINYSSGGKDVEVPIPSPIVGQQFRWRRELLRGSALNV